jgi:D-xylose transport system permease protein
MTSVDKPTAPAPEPVSADQSDADVPIVTSEPPEGGVGPYFRNYVNRVRGGEMGSLPAGIGLVVLVLFFWFAQPNFHTLFNFGNMFTEGTATIFIAMGLVFALLLGEIDLAAGYAGGVSAAVMVRLTLGYGAPWPLSIGAALVTGLIIGLLTGWLRAKVRIPSFIVTLAFFLAFQGVMQWIVQNGPGAHGDLPMTDSVQLAFANSQMPLWAGWALGGVVVFGYAFIKLTTIRDRLRRGLTAEPWLVAGVKILTLAVVTFGLIYLLSLNRALNQGGGSFKNINGKIVAVETPAVAGVPWVVPVLLVLLVIWSFLLSRTRYGRHVYAVGGNEEAARRAGIPVDRIRMSVFVLCSFMAAIGGIMLASNVSSVSVKDYGGNVLLLAVGAAVVGGTSLFGGKGRMIDALIGGAVIEVIYNGMATLVHGPNSSAFQYIATGLALLLAAAADAITRRRTDASA